MTCFSGLLGAAGPELSARQIRKRSMVVDMCWRYDIVAIVEAHGYVQKLNEFLKHLRALTPGGAVLTTLHALVACLL